MQYLCTMQLTLAGVTYNASDIIPNGAILPERVGKLIQSGYIAEIKDEIPEKEDDTKQDFTKRQIEVPILKEDQIITAFIDEESVEVWSLILQKNAAEAIEMVKVIDNDNLLMLIHATDNRKSVKAAAEARAAELNPELMETLE